MVHKYTNVIYWVLTEPCPPVGRVWLWRSVPMVSWVPSGLPDCPCVGVDAEGGGVRVEMYMGRCGCVCVCMCVCGGGVCRVVLHGVHVHVNSTTSPIPKLWGKSNSRCGQVMWLLPHCNYHHPVATFQARITIHWRYLYPQAISKFSNTATNIAKKNVGGCKPENYIG